MPAARKRRIGSVRLRTAVAAGLALVPALLVFSISGVLVQRHQLTDGVALVAEEQANAVAASLADPATAPGSSLATSVRGEATLIQVLGPDGQVVDSSPALSGEPATVDAG